MKLNGQKGTNSNYQRLNIISNNISKQSTHCLILYVSIEYLDLRTTLMRVK